jgi:hypothetical protein
VRGQSISVDRIERKSPNVPVLLKDAAEALNNVLFVLAQLRQFGPLLTFCGRHVQLRGKRVLRVPKVLLRRRRSWHLHDARPRRHSQTKGIVSENPRGTVQDERRTDKNGTDRIPDKLETAESRKTEKEKVVLLLVRYQPFDWNFPCVLAKEVSLGDLVSV